MKKDFEKYGELVSSFSKGGRYVSMYLYNDKIYFVEILNFTGVELEFAIRVLKFTVHLMKDWFTIFNKKIELEHTMDKNKSVISYPDSYEIKDLISDFSYELSLIMLKELPRATRLSETNKVFDKIYQKVICKGCLLAVKDEII